MGHPKSLQITCEDSKCGGLKNPTNYLAEGENLYK